MLSTRVAFRQAQNACLRFGKNRNLSTKANFFEKNEKLKRPMSPHLTIYRPEVTSLLSISHRISGVMWGVGLSTVAIGIAVAPHDFTHYFEAVKASPLATPGVVTGTKFLVCFPLVYHTVNGCRHLAWDRGMNLSLPAVYKTGYIVLGLSAAATLAITQI